MPRKMVVQQKGRGRRPRSTSRSRLSKQHPYFEGSSALDGPMAYIRMVKDTFRYHPGNIYQQFMKILSNIQDPKVDLIQIVDEVILLFDGYPDLIYSFNTFLPPSYEIQLQEDAVVVKVYEQEGGSGASNSALPASALTMKNHGEAVGYITAVKRHLERRPRHYMRFMQILAEFHSKQADEVTTVQNIVQLLKKYPELVLGFNSFLPHGYQIQMISDSAFMLVHPNPDGTATKLKLH